MRRLLAAALVLGFAATAAAQPESAYYGLALGSFDYQEDAFPGFFSGVSGNTDSWRVMVGYQLLEHLAVEGGLGKTSALRDTPTLTIPGPPGTPPISETLNYSTEFSSLMIRMLGVMNFDNGFTVLGGIGYAEMNQDFALSDQAGNSESFDQDVGEPTYYVGAQYDWDRFGLRLAYEKYEFPGGAFNDDGDIKETTLTFFYRL
jgi:hypothetical protein